RERLAPLGPSLPRQPGQRLVLLPLHANGSRRPLRVPRPGEARVVHRRPPDRDHVASRPRDRRRPLRGLRYARAGLRAPRPSIEEPRSEVRLASPRLRPGTRPILERATARTAAPLFTEC